MAEMREDWVCDVIDSSNIFSWKVYKKTSNPLHHIGIMVFLNNMRAFTVDISSYEGKKERTKTYFTRQIESEGVIKKAKYNEIVTIQDFIQKFEIRDRNLKEYVKKQIREWVDVTEKYDILDHNCRNHTENCINVARQMFETDGDENMAINENAVEQARALIEDARKTDSVLTLPTRFMSLFKGRKGQESNENRPKKNFLMGENDNSDKNE